MKKKQTAFRLPPDLLDWMATQDQSQTDLVIEGLKLLSETNLEAVKKKAKKLGVTPGRLLDVALHRFNDLPTDEQYDALIDYYKIIRENPPKGEK